jgi:hypothetical protein
MSTVYRKTVPLAILWIMVIVTQINYFTGEMQEPIATLSGYMIILGSFFVFTAAAGYLLRAFGTISRYFRTEPEKRTGAYVVEYTYATILFVAMLVIYAFQGQYGEGVTFIVQYLLRPASTATIALTASYIAIGLFHHWGIRSFESALLVLTTIFVLLGRAQVVIGTIPMVSDLGVWLEETMVAPVARTFTIMVAIGTATMLISTLRGRTTATG